MIARGKVGFVFCALLAVSTLNSPSRGQDFAQWRGPARDGVSGFVPPKTWPRELRKVWQVDVGLGHASPAVVGDKVYCFARQGDDEVLLCLGLADGERVFRQAYAAPYEVNAVAAEHGPGPKSTPAVADGHAVTLGISGILSCFSAADGTRIWQHDFRGEFERTSPLYGTSASPLVAGGVCYAFVGGHDGGALAAFDVATGREKWRWEGDGPGYASPVLATIEGQRQIVVQSQKNVIGVSLDGKLLWKQPFETEYVQNCVTPVMVGEGVLLGGYQVATALVQPSTKGEEWTVGRKWENSEIPMYLSTPVVKGGKIFGFTQRNAGQLFCADAKTGKVLWRGQPRQGENAALVLAGDALLVLTNRSQLVVVSADAKEYDELASYGAATSQTWAHPVPTKHGLLIKDTSALALWSLR
jgi:outer membrane protein assembly factor BamB